MPTFFSRILKGLTSMATPIYFFFFAVHLRTSSNPVCALSPRTRSILNSYSATPVASGFDMDALQGDSEGLLSQPPAKRPRMDDNDASTVTSFETVSQGQETRMTEARAGITEYIDASLCGFQGIIKQRFTDFMVNEIDLAEKVCRVTSLDPPPGKYFNQLHPNASPSSSTAAAATKQEDQKDHEKRSRQSAHEQAKERLEQGLWPSDAKDRLAPFFPASSIAALKEMWEKGKAPESMGTGANATIVSRSSITTRVLVDKQERTQVHKLVRELFNGKFATDSCTLTTSVDEEDALANGSEGPTTSTAATGIAVRWANKSDRRAGDDLPDEALNSPPYIHFLLQKTNRDHQEAMAMLAQSLCLGGGGGRGGRCRGRGGSFGGRGGGRPQTKDLSVAGTKDKRAVTVQQVSLKRNRKTLDDVYRLVNGITTDASAARSDNGSRAGRGKGKGRDRTVHDAVSARGEHGIRIAHLSYAHHPLKLGQLRGNEFTITLRNVRPLSSDHCVGKAESNGHDQPQQHGPVADFSSEIHRSMQVIRDRGFINYFGMQRFGTGAIPTHHIGILVLKNDFKGAIDLLLTPRTASSPTADDGDSIDLLKAKAHYREGELDKAYFAMPKNCIAEKHILDKMRRHNFNAGDWMGAFGNIPRTLRLMYVHAYQSYVWNRLVSERIARFGSEGPVEGDVVFVQPDADHIAEDDAAFDDGAGDAQGGVDGDVDEHEDEDAARNQRKPLASPQSIPAWQRSVKILQRVDLDPQAQATEQGVSDARAWSIYDVVLPLPGSSIELPSGWMSELYTQILAQDGLTHQHLTSSKMPEYQLKGSYRRIVVQPRQFDYSITPYTDPDVPLTQTDEEICLNLDHPSTAPVPVPATQTNHFTALTLKFQLPSSSYATMLMREALKSDTSSFRHRQMTQLSQDQRFKGIASS